MQLSVHPLRAERRDAGFDLLEELDVSLRDAGLKVQNGDVVVVSSKYLAVSQGRVLRVEDIAESAEAAGLARRYGLSPKVAEAVIREADSILGGTRGFVLASVGGIVAPNAGIDRSNAGGDRMVLYPQEPYLAAEQICRRIFLRHAARVGVIIADSRLMPGRSGTVGVSIACAGIDPLDDMRGREDLDGNPLKVTFQAVSDCLASAGNYGMGEGSQSTPMALVRGSGAKLTSRRILPQETAVDESECIYVRALREGARGQARHAS